ncbi:MAG TPA: hypothetical protein VF691_10685 [Cytophagaceae bacterium]|jgi:hypothetical protein
MESTCKDISISEDLKSYVSFIRRNKIREVISDIIKLSQDLKLPVLKQLAGQSAEKIYQLFHLGVHEFFNDILMENPIEGVKKLLAQWRNKQVASEITSLSIDDIVSSYMIRKQVLVSYINDYSSEPLVYINLVQELNNIVCLAEKAAMDALGFGAN